MEQISMAALVYLLAVIALNYALLKRGQKKYGAMVKPLSKKEFALKDFFPIGFVLMELIRWRYGSALDRKLRRQLIELYEPDYTEYYLRVLWAAAASYLAIGALLSAVLFLGAGAAGLAFGWGIGAAMAYVSFGDLQKKIERRHLQIAIDMPDFTNKILILSGAGMTIRAALLKISHEMAADTPLYEELAHTVFGAKRARAAWTVQAETAAQRVLPAPSRVQAEQAVPPALAVPVDPPEPTGPQAASR